jgi:hypothetical protein
MEMELIHKL